MKKILIKENNASGLESLLGEKVTLFCTRYIYTGILAGIDETCVLLQDPSIVYETGSFDDPKWTDVQRLPKDEWYVMLQSIESYGIMK